MLKLLLAEVQEIHDGLPLEWRLLVHDYGLNIVLGLYDEGCDVVEAERWLVLHRGKPLKPCKSKRLRLYR